MSEVLIVLGSRSDLGATEQGVDFLKDAKVRFSLRIASAHRSPDHLATILKEFEATGGKLVICVAGKSAHLAGVVASHTLKPVFAVPIYGDATAGFDALLSMSQMPGGIPVATFGFGAAGFLNAVLSATQVLALTDERLQKFLREHRRSQGEQVMKDDRDARIDGKGL